MSDAELRSQAMKAAAASKVSLQATKAELISLIRIRANPWQTRSREDLEHVSALARDIAEHGLLQAPMGRPAGGFIELAFGHSRLAAFRLLAEGDRRWDEMPVNVQMLSDREMSDLAAAENAARKDLSAIETARAIQKRMADFSLTQLEAARVFGYTSQGAVSNLLRLLKLPEAVRAMIGADIPERIGRQLAGVVEALPEAKVIEVAEEIARFTGAEQDEEAEQSIGQALDECCMALQDAAWAAEWKPADDEHIAVEVAATTAVPPACEGCEHRHAVRYDSFCMDKNCYRTKQELWVHRELGRVAEKLQIPVAVPGESVRLLEVDYSTFQAARNLMKRKERSTALRLIPNPDGKNDYSTRDLTGSNVVAIAAFDPKMLKRHAPGTAGGAPSVPVKKDGETAEERSARVEAEEEEKAARREESAAERRARADVAWLIIHAGEVLGPQLQIEGPMLCDAAEVYERVCHFSMAECQELIVPLSDLEKRSDDGDEPAQRAYIIVQCLAEKILGAGYSRQDVLEWKRALAETRLIAERFGCELPAGWDQPPVHKTDANCHVCGRFTSMGRITKIDEAAGWQLANGVVTCSPECRRERGGMTSMAKLAPRTAGAKASVKTRPAPKPSAAARAMKGKGKGKQR